MKMVQEWHKATCGWKRVMDSPLLQMRIAQKGVNLEVAEARPFSSRLRSWRRFRFARDLRRAFQSVRSYRQLSFALVAAIVRCLFLLILLRSLLRWSQKEISILWVKKEKVMIQMSNDGADSAFFVVVVGQVVFPRLVRYEWNRK